MEHVNGIPYLIGPSRGGGAGGGGILLVRGRLQRLLRAQHPRFTWRGGPLVPLWPGGLLAEAVAGHLLLVGVEVPCFDILGAPLKHGGGADLKHTSDCPRCMVQYETWIPSVMAQVQDLWTQNQELQRSHQELSQPVSTAAGINQSYGDRMTLILSTLAKYDAVVHGYHRDSRGVAASVSDLLKMSNSNTAKFFSAVETLATRYASVASRIDAWDQWYTTPAEPVLVVPPCH